MSRSSTSTGDRWSELNRSGRIVVGKALVTERLESVGCAVRAPSSLIDGKLDARTASGRSIEVFVSTQRVGGYVFWTKRRLQPARTRFAAIVLLAEGGDPVLYLVPTTTWLTASPPFTDRDNVGKRSVGKRSEPEFGISLARSSLPALERYRWHDRSARDYLR